MSFWSSIGQVAPAHSSPLASLVSSFWLHRSEPQARSRVLPTGTAQLIIDLSGDGLCVPDHSTSSRSRDTFPALFNGADTAAFLLETDRPLYQFGVDFKPGGAYPFFAPPASELQDAHLPLDALWSAGVVNELSERVAAASTLAERVEILEEILLRQIVRPLDHHPAVRLALQAFSNAPQSRAVAAVADAAGLSAGRLTRVFREEVGLTPKQYARVRRFRWALRRLHTGSRVNWARLAVDCGYYDQAHLIKDFQTFAGVCPSAYLRARDARSPTTLLLNG
jgi:AraC-like DNA-binding protein